MLQPILSIITVSYQAKNELHTTISSVLEQTWSQYEYLVIDGKSSDGTFELLEQASATFEQKNISFRFISEPDQGIYDAMNKGARLADGRWLLFLNAGDTLTDSSVLEKVFKEELDTQIIYGDTICTYLNNSKLYPALPLSHLRYEMSFCHQSAFIQRELLLAHPYDVRYRVCADHHFFLSMYLSEQDFYYCGFPIARYEISGYSDRNIFQAHREQRQIQKELGVFHRTPAWLFREGRFYVKQGIKAIFGQAVIDLVRRIVLRPCD